MIEKGLLCARRAMETLAERDGISPDEVRSAIREAIEQAQKNAASQSAELWRDMTDSGEPPTPEELILWAVRRIGY